MSSRLRASPGVWFRTLSHLEWSQIYGQVWHRARLAMASRLRSNSTLGDPPSPACRWSPRARFLGSSANVDGDALVRGEFEFLNRSARLGWPPRWDADVSSRLWHYNLHYFDFLWVLPFDQGRMVVLDWIAWNRKMGQGLEAYPTSLRVMNWCGYFFADQAEFTEKAPVLRDVLWASLFDQLEWLGRHVETHLRGNHVLENAAALALGGSCFEGAHARSWLHDGMALLEKELSEQVLADGGHFERSPMYHLRLLWVLTALFNVGTSELQRLVEGPLRRAMDAGRRLVHPDGDCALLNDSAHGVYPRFGQLENWWTDVAGEPRSETRWGAFALMDTGYYGAAHANGDYLICDAGPVGPDYQPGHAHGDIFSFELSLGGQRVICDAGVHGYEGDALRPWCRSTRAHNTVEIEGLDQCEFWSVFRVGARGRPRDVRFEVTSEGFRLSGWHDGYLRLPQRARHWREFVWDEERGLGVRDRVESEVPTRSVSRLHLHPDCRIVDRDDELVEVAHSEGIFWVAFAGRGKLDIERTLGCPEFGLARESQSLVYHRHVAGDITSFFVTKRSREDARSFSQSLLSS
ncbi:heparinase II/III family protein [Myxococcota bacterium]|nr:heparinase II/III family protein [Myxococcota bacterium]